jgi:hypothetical protein
MKKRKWKPKKTLVLESFVIVGSFDCDHTIWLVLNKTWLTFFAHNNWLLAHWMGLLMDSLQCEGWVHKIEVWLLNQIWRNPLNLLIMYQLCSKWSPFWPKTIRANPSFGGTTRNPLKECLKKVLKYACVWVQN